MFHVCILCSPSLDRHYIGQTGDVHRRVNFHAAHSTPFTARANDWQLIFLEPVNTRQEAMALERRIKRAKNRDAIARFVRNPRNTIQQPIPISDW